VVCRPSVYIPAVLIAELADCDHVESPPAEPAENGDASENGFDMDKGARRFLSKVSGMDLLGAEAEQSHFGLS